ncbi:UTP--glucose-1-phosphate uridylyltransferase [Arcanobacterium canis]
MELTASQSQALSQNLEKLRADGASATAMRVFEGYFGQVAGGATGLIPEDTITPITDVPDIRHTDVDPDDARRALGQTVFFKLNGGLGTSMGLDKAKSLLPVRDGLTFLDIMTEQIFKAREKTGVNIPLMFLNSFRTRSDTLEVAHPDLATDLPLDVLQSREPKILEDSLEPVSWPENPELEWCPPGHGDIYTAFYESGILDQMLDAGYRYLNTSNSDNLGAYPSASIAGWFAQSGADYSPEVCHRTLADVKGGHLAIRKSDGRVILRDTGQTPAEDMTWFTDLYRHPYFHTNNLWFNIESLRDLLHRTEGVLDLPLIRNRKNVDPTQPHSPHVIQMECAMGAIVEKFATSQPICVGRERFLPVKTTNDLALVRCDAYEYSQDSRLILRHPSAPVISLDSRYYKFIQDFDRHFLDLPSLEACESFTVNGEWFFEGDVSFSGNVILDGEGRVRGK